MAPPSQSDIEQKLTSLQAEFKRTLPDKVANIEQLWDSLLAGNANDSAIIDCHRMAHSLVGSGATFGATIISKVSRELEQVFKTHINQSELSSEIKSVISDLILKLKSVVDTWQPLKQPLVQSVNKKHIENRQTHLIYIAEDDELLAKNIIVQLKNNGFIVKYFNNLKDFSRAYSDEVPSAIIMDVMFKEGSSAGIDTIASLNKEDDTLPPTIFISTRNDMETRLAATEAASIQRYFCKPVDVNKLTQSLDSLIIQPTNKSYRVLFIDDDVSLLEYYETVLVDAGIEVKTISNPMDSLEALENFTPDVIILDVHMAECSGPQVAQVIRQDDSLALTPIIFLSNERDFDVKLGTTAFSGESFIAKPITARHLISVVKAKSESARWNHKVNEDLEEAIREGEYQLITSNEHNIVSVADVSGRIINVNDKFCEISGYSREELIGQNHRLLKSDNHPDSFYEDMWNTISRGKVWHGTICNTSKTNKEYWVESTIVPFLDKNGKPYKYVSARTDVTTVIEGEARLERSQKFANIGTWDWNIETGALFWSDRIWSLFGYDKQATETTYDNFMAAIHSEDRQLVSDAITSCIENKSEYNIEHRVVWPDSSIHWVHESGNVIRGRDNKPRHMLGVVQDITNRKEAELELQASKEKLSGYFALSPLGFALTNMDGGYIEFNESFRKICGYPVTELRELDYWELTPKEYEKDEAKQLELLNTTGRYGPYEKEYRQKDGTLKPIRLNGMLIKDENGDSQIWSIIEDISDSKKAQIALIEAREEAEDANRAKSQFLSSMSHELRTPMNAIMGFGQLLTLDIGNPLNESQSENVNEILKASDHLLELINEVLDLAKIEAGRIDLSIDDVLVGEVIAESLQLILPLADRRGISVRLYRDETEISINDLEKDQSVVRADYTRTKQVIINLLSNAVKYNSENGNIAIKCSKTESNIRIDVTDTGTGLNQEQLSQLFTAFNRLGAENSEIEGTGIGLVITQNIVELMGGHIGVESEAGTGSTFWFELPNGATELSDTVKDTSSSNVEIELEESRSVLYIEDNPANLRLVTQLLGRLPNLHMWTAHEPMLGLELAATNKPDLILLDINLPGMDGFEVLKLLKGRDGTKNTPVIAISANAMPYDIEKGLEAGFDDYITKPIDINALLLAVDEKLKK